MKPFQIRSVRGSVVDTLHEVHAVVRNADGQTVATWGDAALTVLTRSAAKPFQAMAVVRGGAAGRFEISPRELATVCASHNGEQEQVDVVSALLTRIGRRENDLVCRPHRPLLKDLGYHLPGSQPDVALAPPSRVSSNCSGKHTGMLALALALDAPVHGYERVDHPVQRAGRAELQRWCDTSEADLGESVDGCGVVCWSLPLRDLALGYARLGVDPDSAAIAVRDAMIAHPGLVAGHRRLCTALMGEYPGVVLAKIGAGGVYGAAVPASGLGVAVKVLDGNPVAAGVAVLHVLDALGCLERAAERLEAFVRPAILNTLRHRVGYVEAASALSLD